MLDHREARALLRRLDERRHVEFPSGYHHRRERERFEQLVERVQADFRCVCAVDRDVQDASYHGALRIPAEATATGSFLTLKISNFGAMAVLCLEVPGCYDAEETATLLDERDSARVAVALTDLGYVQVPEEVLWEDYDGPHAAWIESWWIRYFDYL
jgi:hypothetical protein